MQQPKRLHMRKRDAHYRYKGFEMSYSANVRVSFVWMCLGARGAKRDRKVEFLVYPIYFPPVSPSGIPISLEKRIAENDDEESFVQRTLGWNSCSRVTWTKVFFSFFCKFPKISSWVVIFIYLFGYLSEFMNRCYGFSSNKVFLLFCKFPQISSWRCDLFYSSWIHVPESRAFLCIWPWCNDCGACRNMARRRLGTNLTGLISRNENPSSTEWKCYVAGWGRPVRRVKIM